MTSKIENKSDLNYFIYDKEYPLHSNAAILCVGSAGCGKSYFVYKYLLPIYIKYGGVKTILICSRTANIDFTTVSELENPIYKDVGIDFIKVEESYERCQLIRSNAMINEYIEKFMNAKSDEQVESLLKQLKKTIKTVSDLTIIHNELLKFYGYVSGFVSIDVDTVHEYARLLWLSGSKITYNPIVIVFDDMSGTDDFIKPYSDLHKLIYVRRHLHLTMIMNVQSLTTISVNIRRNTTVFVCFSTLSEQDVKLLSSRIPIHSGMNQKELREVFCNMANSEDRNDKVLTLFTVFPNCKVTVGTPQCLKDMIK